MFKKLSIIIVLLIAGRDAGAQTVFRSLEEVWKYADDHNVTIKTAKLETDKALYAKKQAVSALLPQASVNGSFTQNMALQTTLIPAEIFGGPVGVYRPIQFGQKYIYSGGFTAQMDILNLQSWYNVQIAKYTEAYNNASLANTRKTVYQQVASQYYSYLLMQEAATLAAQSALIADSALQSINNKFSEGTANGANVDAAKINLERAQQTQITAQYQMLTAKNNIKALLDLSVTDSVTFTAALQYDAFATSGAPFQEDPAIRLAFTQTQMSIGQYRAAKSTFAPTLSILYSNSTQQNDNIFEPFRPGGPEWYPAKYWTLRASWNLFNSGGRYFQAKRNKIAYDESMLQYEQAQKQSAITDENIRLSYMRSAAVLHKTEDVMKLSLDNYMHISYRYSAGIESIETRLNAFKDYIDYQNQYLNSLSDMLVQLYQVKIRQQTF